MAMIEFHKYVRTPHIRGSRLQHGDHDLEAVDFSVLEGRRLVLEEKMDGSNAGISFVNGEMKLQSRGHFLRGGPRERHFDLFKQWAACHEEAFYCALGERYVMYGEWLYAKHTCFYDGLPHYFMEFDLYDKQSDSWASTEARQAHYRDNGVDHIVTPVLVVGDGSDWTLEGLRSMIGRSNFKTVMWEQKLRAEARRVGQNADFAIGHTDTHDEMEGLYIKWEDDDRVLGRYKFVRDSFTNSIMDQETHWTKRVIIPNGLLPGAYEGMFSQD